MDIQSLVDLNKLRTAPLLSLNQVKKLLTEIETEIINCDWITIGVMASSDLEAIAALQSISKKYPSISFNNFEELSAKGSVFLKGNQKTGNIFIRSEDGLGEGILLTCQYDDHSLYSSTYGPFPLDFFLINF